MDDRVGSLDSNRVDDVIEAHSNALYAGGALFLSRNGTLLAQRVDERDPARRGEPVPLAENVLMTCHSVGRCFPRQSADRSSTRQAPPSPVSAGLAGPHGQERRTSSMTPVFASGRAFPRTDGGRHRRYATPVTGNVDIRVYQLG